MSTLRALTLGLVTSLGMPLVPPLWAQSPPLNWMQQVPSQTDSGAMALHPTTGRPVRFGGRNQQIGTFGGTWEWNGTRWLGRVGSTNPGPREGHAMATDAARGRVVMFGGSSFYGTDTWTWDGRDWQAHPTPPLLTPRTDHAMAFDSVRGRVVLFGGQLQNDTWEWDGAAWTLRQPGAPPPARGDHAMAFDAARGRLVLFGGRGLTGTLNDTWEWDGSVWRQRFSINPPTARFDHGMTYDSTRQRVVLFGGALWNAWFDAKDDTWEWDGASWTQVHPALAPPPSSGHTMLWDRTQGRVLMFGTPRSGEDAWSFDGSTWHRVAGPSAPPPRSATAMSYDAPRGRVVLFGGYGSSITIRNRADTWTWDGTQWLEQSPANAPSGRYGHTMAFDPVRGVTTLFGGTTYTSPPSAFWDQTWSWDGTTWLQEQPNTRPPARTACALAYHAATQRLVLFGGSTPSGTLGDTWSWDGNDWTQESPVNSPTARFRPGLASAGQDVLLFGGGLIIPNANPQPLDDTWRWNGNDWTHLAPASTPPAQFYDGLVEDVDLGRVLLIGEPATSSTPIARVECWSWNGTTWSRLPTSSAPPARGAALTYDSGHGVTLRFGSDTWTLAAAFSEGTFGAGCPGTLGLPTLSNSPQSLPRPGGTVIADLANLPTPLVAIMMGFSDTMIGSQQLPLSLSQFGMPGCDLFVAPDATAVVPVHTGAATWRLPIPFQPTFLGLEFFYQALAFDPPANAAGLTVSNAGRCRVGH